MPILLWQHTHIHSEYHMYITHSHKQFPVNSSCSTRVFILSVSTIYQFLVLLLINASFTLLRSHSYTRTPVVWLARPSFPSFFLARLPHCILSPVRLLVICQQLLHQCLDSDEPAGHRLVDERCLGAPAERIGVVVLTLVDQTTSLLQHLCDKLVSFLVSNPNEVIITYQIKEFQLLLGYRCHCLVTILESILWMVCSRYSREESGYLLRQFCLGPCQQLSLLISPCY